MLLGRNNGRIAGLRFQTAANRDTLEVDSKRKYSLFPALSSIFSIDIFNPSDGISHSVLRGGATG
jgi:hypothetical protein